MRRILMMFAVTLGVSAGACGGKTEPAAGGGGEAPAAADKPAADKPAAAAGPKELKLSNGITVTAPGDAKESAMGQSITVSALGGKCQAMIGEKSDMSPSFDNHIQNIERGNKGGPLKEMKRKEQKGPDDFIIEWTTDKRFGYASRKTVQGKVLYCDRVSADADGHACVVSICESMK